MENSACGGRYSLGVENRNGTAELGNADTNIPHVFSTDRRTRLHRVSVGDEAARLTDTRGHSAHPAGSPADKHTQTFTELRDELFTLKLHEHRHLVWFGFVFMVASQSAGTSRSRAPGILERRECIS